MKGKFIWLIAVLLLLVTKGAITQAQQTFNEKYLKDSSIYVFDDLLKIRQGELFTTYRSEFGLGSNDQMRQTNNEVLENGTFRTKYELYHKGVRVEGSMMNVLGTKGIVQRANGFLLSGLNENITSMIDPGFAIQKAIEFIGARKYLWQDSLADSAAVYPYPRLIITKKRGAQYAHTMENYQLCYKVTIQAIDPFSFTDVFVNANTGEIFTSQIGIEADYTATGTLWTWYNNWHNDITTRSCGGCFNFWLHDVNRNIYTTTHGKKYWNKGFYNEDNNNNWVENDTKTAASAHWAVEKAWDYYINRHGRWGTDYQGKLVHIQTRFMDTSQPNAYYSNLDIYGVDNGHDNIYITADGVYPAPSTPGPGYSLAALDVLAHEYTHGMIKRSSGLGSLGDFEAKALNEGYADIFGMRIEGYVTGSLDWSVGETLGGLGTRYFANPHSDVPVYSPSIYHEVNYWWDDTLAHMDGGVLRKWFYLLANGGTFNNETVSPLGIESADDIAYITFNWWLWPNVKYPEAAVATTGATDYTYGKCSQENKQTIRALRAVGFKNIPIPLCNIVIIEGPKVVGQLEGGPFVWHANLNDIADRNGTYHWNIPNGWTAIAGGNTLTVNSITDFSNFDSKKLSVSYTTQAGIINTDTIVVHFSDVTWTPTHNLPPLQAFNNNYEDKDILGDGHIQIYPNPAQTKFTIKLAKGDKNAQMELFDIKGVMVKSINMESSIEDININDLTAGIYLVRIKTSEKVFTQKLTVVH